MDGRFWERFVVVSGVCVRAWVGKRSNAGGGCSLISIGVLEYTAHVVNLGMGTLGNRILGVGNFDAAHGFEWINVTFFVCEFRILCMLARTMQLPRGIISRCSAGSVTRMMIGKKKEKQYKNAVCNRDSLLPPQRSASHGK